MSVFDKELIINGKAVRSPEQQVWKNMKDIEALQGKIKDVYSTSATLTSASVSVATSDTNVGEAEDGWLMTEDGLLFEITGNDGDNVLLKYYADLKGPQGEPGAAVSIDDTGTSATKCWSSQKTSDEILDVYDSLDKGIYYTNTQPTDDTTIDKSAILNVNGLVPIRQKDLLIYIDASNNPTSLYYVYSISGTTITVTKLGDYAKGKQLYQHNITFRVSSIYYHATITNYSNTPLTQDTFFAWLVAKGFTDTNNKYYNMCYSVGTTKTRAITDNGTTFICLTESNSGSGQNKVDILGFTDDPIEL